MNYLLWILISYLGLTSCRSSYDESQKKPEVKTQPKAPSNASQQPLSPIVESTPPAQPTTPSNGGGTSATPVGDQPAPLPTTDQLMLATQHDATPEELKKYNCKGTARITDSGIDDNKDGVLQDDEIQETRIDCTEVVPGTTVKP